MVWEFLQPLEELFEHLPEIEKYIEEVHPEKVHERYLTSVTGKPSYANISEKIEESLFKPNWDMLHRPRSCLRPLIFLLIMGGLGKKLKDYAKYAALVELIHNGTLIHDDIEDNAQVRRGDKPIHLKYGTDVAVNSANIMYFSPFLLLNKYKEFSKEKQLQLYEIIIEHLNRVTWGQAIDISWHNGLDVPSVEEYMQMCCYKTGAIDRLVFSLAGALAELEQEKYEKLKDFGEKFGIFLQMHDDFCDFCSIDRGNIGGKSIGNDITEGKRSIINIFALKELEKSNQESLLRILQKHTTNASEINRAIDLIDSTSAVRNSLNAIQKLAEHLKQESPSLFNEKYAKMMEHFLNGMEKDVQNKYSEKNKA